MRPTLAVLSLGLVAACSSGGGGGVDAVPTLVSAVFIGGGGSPASGDRLQLNFSEDVMLTGAVLDDVDVALSSGTLGTIPAAPTLVSARVLEVTLGTGVTFTPGTTTIDFDLGNDAVRDLTGNLVQASTAKTITAGDAEDPTIAVLTVNGVVNLLNGTGPAGGVMQVPPSGFTIDLTYADVSSAVDPAQTVISASVVTTAGGVARAPGQNLLPDLTVLSATPTAASYQVPATLVFPNLPLVLTVQVADTTGRVSSLATFSLQVTPMSNAIRPFETVVNSSQVWYLDLTRDIEAFTVNLANISTPVQVGPANGNPDLLDLFTTIGLQHGSPIPNVVGSKDSNEVVMDLFRTALAAELQAFYAGVNITFTFTSPGPFPNAQGFLPYNNGSFSQMCIAGSADLGGNTGVLGLALFDPNNESQINDCLTDFQGSRLGVFLHTIVNSGFKMSPVSFFRQTYDAFTPARAGTPIGADANDNQRLTDVLNDARATQIDQAIQRMARTAAVVGAHEMGHSMGLVPSGAMPAGLYGGDTVNFPGSSTGHIVMPGSVFTGGAINVMSPSLDFNGMNNAGTRFNSLNIAYLRERALYNVQ